MKTYIDMADYTTLMGIRIPIEERRKFGRLEAWDSIDGHNNLVMSLSNSGGRKTMCLNRGQVERLIAALQKFLMETEAKKGNRKGKTE